MSPRRLLWLIPIVLVLAIAYSAWLAWRVQGSLTAAEASATQLKDAINADDAQARGKAAQSLRTDAQRAVDRTDGAWWSAMTHVPFVGDDATGVRALSRSLDTVATRGVQPLAQTMDQVHSLTKGGRVHLDVVDTLQQPVAHAASAFAQADAQVSDLDSSGYVGRLKTRFDHYVSLMRSTSHALDAAETATEVLPTMLGADGPRDYLLVFQNNAEIRATGGLPGAWARIHAQHGKLTIKEQGAGSDFGERSTPVLPLTSAERKVYGPQLGTYFLDANFTPDFPRAAQLWAARWQEKYSTKLDGVLSLDPVAMSYLLKGTGPVPVGDLTLTSDNVVQQLLNEPYKTLGPDAQDLLFQQAAQAIFQASTGQVQAPMDFVEGLGRAAREGRLLVDSFDDQVASDLKGSRVEGALAGDDGKTPHVDVGLTDATGSKMSYYLRYQTDVEATGCTASEQTLQGSMTLNQTISPAEARKLPDYVTGGGHYGTAPGSQLAFVRLYGPYGGSIDSLSINGKSLAKSMDVTELNGRPVTTVTVLLSSTKDVALNWTMQTGKGQTADAKLGMTPSIVAGDNNATIKSAC